MRLRLSTWVIALQAVGLTVVLSGCSGSDGSDGVAGATGPAGVDGAQGATGVTGAVGIDGIDGTTGTAGPAGVDGAQGATGVTGAAGVDGAQGATGVTGAIGATGATGATGAASSGSLLFSFIGSSGTLVDQNTVGGYSTCFFPSGVATADVLIAGGFSATTLDASVVALVDSSCSELTGYASIVNEPGGYASEIRIIRIASPTALGVGVVSSDVLCGFSGSQTTCNGTIPVSFAAGDQISICLRASYYTPPHTQVAWSLMCSKP